MRRRRAPEPIRLRAAHGYYARHRLGRVFRREGAVLAEQEAEVPAHRFLVYLLSRRDVTRRCARALICASAPHCVQRGQVPPRAAFLRRAVRGRTAKAQFFSVPVLTTYECCGFTTRAGSSRSQWLARPFSVYRRALIRSVPRVFALPSSPRCSRYTFYPNNFKPLFGAFRSHLTRLTAPWKYKLPEGAKS